MSDRGLAWIKKLPQNGQAVSGFTPSVMVTDGLLGETACRFIAVVKDERNAFPRARAGEVGLLEGWDVAKAVQDLRLKEASAKKKTPIVAIVDVPSQAYGRREEAYGIHQSLAAAANAYAQAKMEGHPVISLIVGKAMSGGFLAHGYQASCIIALDDEGCMVHAMGKESAAKVTLRTVEQLEAIASKIPPMAYDIQNYNSLGLLFDLIKVKNAANPGAADIQVAQKSLEKALAWIKKNGNTLTLHPASAKREMTEKIRKAMAERW